MDIKELEKLKADVLAKVEEIDKAIADAETEEIIKRLVEMSYMERLEPELNERYFLMYDNGDVKSSCWKDEDIDKERYAMGNVFKTKEKAERKVFEIKLDVKLRDFALKNNEWEINWNNLKQKKWYIYCDCKNYELSVGCTYKAKYYRNVYFTSEEICNKAIETFKDDLIRYFTIDK